MPASPACRVSAIMMVRNEASIVVDSIGHLLGLGVHRLHVIDNGSSDRTPLLLEAIAAIDPRLRWRRAPGRFEQAVLTTSLARDAWEDGATWILPADADEFFDPGPGGLARLAEAANAGALAVPVRNFVQSRALARLAAPGRPDAGTIDTMIFAAEPVGTSRSARSLVESGAIAFVHGAYPLKYLFRATEGLALHAGAHGADGIAGQTLPLEGAVILHAPLRTRGDLARRLDKAARVAEIARDPDQSWHLRRLLGLSSEALDREWRRNSTLLGRWRPSTGRLRLDGRLRRLARGLRPFRAQVAAAAARDR